MTQNNVQPSVLENMKDIDASTVNTARNILSNLSSSEIARLLESSPPKSRSLLWDLLDKNIAVEVLSCIGTSDVKSDLVERLNPREISQITETLSSSDVRSILGNLPEQATQQVLNMMSRHDRDRLERSAEYPKNSAGDMMQTNLLTLRPDLTAKVALEYLRQRGNDLPRKTSNVYLVNQSGEFVGIVHLADLIRSPEDIMIRGIIDSNATPIDVGANAQTIANLFERNSWHSAPVVDRKNHLVGKITVEEVIDIIRDSEGYEEDTFASFGKIAPRRGFWLGINLITALLASIVISNFTDIIEEVVALAVMLPVVASMSGIAGTQVLTVVIRGLSKNTINGSNLGWLLRREIWLGMFNGVLWGSVLAVVSWFWFSDSTIPLVISSAIVVNLVVAAAAGVLLPMIMRWLRIDPAIAGGVVLTTITDVIGFLSFLGLAVIYY